MKNVILSFLSFYFFHKRNLEIKFILSLIKFMNVEYKNIVLVFFFVCLFGFFCGVVIKYIKIL